jgi:hypothetical protein
VLHGNIGDRHSADGASSSAPSAASVSYEERALGLQVRDPHDRDHVPIVVRLLFCVLVAGPNKVFLAVKVFPSCSIRSSPRGWGRSWHSSLGPAVFDSGCIMTSRIETVLKPGMRDGVLAIVSTHHYTWPRHRWRRPRPRTAFERRKARPRAGLLLRFSR